MNLTLKIRDSQSFRFFADFKLWFLHKNCLVPRMQFTYDANGTLTLKNLFKAGVPFALESNYARGTKQFLCKNHGLTSANKKPEVRNILA